MQSSKLIEWRDRILVILTSVVTISVVVSQVAAEVATALAGWDGEWVNLVLLIPAIVAIIRRVTPVESTERGILPK